VLARIRADAAGAHDDDRVVRAGRGGDAARRFGDRGGRVIGTVAQNATASLGAAALVRPLAVPGILAPAIAAAILPDGLLAVTPAAGSPG
jgi:hypothetical protein